MHALLGWVILAVQPATIDKLRRIPSESWINLVIWAAAIYVLIRFWRTLKQLNDYAPYMAAAIFMCGVFFYWVYSRTEPSFLTPVVERLTPFFPTRSKQDELIDKARKVRDL